jgi:hypothetical protein
MIWRILQGQTIITIRGRWTAVTEDSVWFMLCTRTNGGTEANWRDKKEIYPKNATVGICFTENWFIICNARERNITKG